MLQLATGFIQQWVSWRGLLHLFNEKLLPGLNVLYGLEVMVGFFNWVYVSW